MRNFQENSAEIHIAGQDGGYGETIVSHIGGNEWVIVDSCRNPKTKNPIPLEILEKRGVNLDKVVLVICTHWHRDHINGLSNIISKCNNAVFCFARPSNEKQFYQFICYDYRLKSKFDASSTDEFFKCLKALRDNGDSKNFKKRVFADQILHSKMFNGNSVRVTSLSPSQKANADFDVEISGLINTDNDLRIPSKTPNDISIVLLLELGNHSILLGADLEVKDDDEYGWLNITRKSSAIGGANKSSLFKIPHHGSENGYHKEIWTVLLDRNPNSILTPFSKHNLPNDEYVEKYTNLSNTLSFTAKPKFFKKPKKRDPETAKLITDLGVDVSEIGSGFGLVSAFINIDDPDSTWKLDYEGEAFLN